MSDEILASVKVSAPRRAFALVTLAGLGALLIWMALTLPPAGLPSQALLIGLGLGSLWLARAMARATAVRLDLTARGLHASDGRVLAPIEDIAGVDRGLFAFKPSGGFLLRLKRRAPRAWVPGLWWRAGRRLGVGGVTSGAQARAMADVLAALLAERDRGEGGRAG